MEKVLVTTAAYRGQYVALNSFDDNEVIGSGATPDEAYRQAQAAGCEAPALVYVEERGTVNIF